LISDLFYCQLFGLFEFTEINLHYQYYRQETLRGYIRPWTKFIRDQIYSEFKERQAKSELRKEKLAIFISKKANSIPKGMRHTKDQIDAFLKTVQRDFTEKIRALGAQMPFLKFFPMKDEDYFTFFNRFLNPSIGTPESRLSCFDKNASIIDSCLCSDGILKMGERIVAMGGANRKNKRNGP
jgi:hypothetical protein